MTASGNLIQRLPTEMGGLPAGPIERVEHELKPWEKRCHALADVLDYHRIINTEEKRCGVEALGREIVSALSYYERWIVAFANILFRKQLMTPEELAVKMDEVAARHSQETYNAICKHKAGRRSFFRRAEARDGSRHYRSHGPIRRLRSFSRSRVGFNRRAAPRWLAHRRTSIPRTGVVDGYSQPIQIDLRIDQR